MTGIALAGLQQLSLPDTIALPDLSPLYGFLEQHQAKDMSILLCLCRLLFYSNTHEFIRDLRINLQKALILHLLTKIGSKHCCKITYLTHTGRRGKVRRVGCGNWNRQQTD